MHGPPDVFSQHAGLLAAWAAEGTTANAATVSSGMSPTVGAFASLDNLFLVGSWRRAAGIDAGLLGIAGTRRQHHRGPANDKRFAGLHPLVSVSSKPCAWGRSACGRNGHKTFSSPCFCTAGIA